MLSALLVFVAPIVAPIVVTFGFVAVMRRHASRDAFDAYMKTKDGAGRHKALNQRFGYRLDDVVDYWSVFDAAAVESERRFLRIDLWFPLFYGGSLLAATWIALVQIDRGALLPWLVAPIVVTMIADWIENSIQIGQLDALVNAGRDANALRPGLIAISSAATKVKLGGAFVAALIWLVAVGWMVVRAALPNVA